MDQTDQPYFHTPTRCGPLKPLTIKKLVYGRNVILKRLYCPTHEVTTDMSGFEIHHHA